MSAKDYLVFITTPFLETPAFMRGEEKKGTKCSRAFRFDADLDQRPGLHTCKVPIDKVSKGLTLTSLLLPR